MKIYLLNADDFAGIIRAMTCGRKSPVQVFSQLPLNTVLLLKAVLLQHFLESLAHTAILKLLKCFAFYKLSGVLLRDTFLPTSIRTMDGLGRMRILSLELFINSILLLAAMQPLFNRESLFLHCLSIDFPQYSSLVNVMILTFLKDALIVLWQITR
jgi:hypothetical protein